MKNPYKQYLESLHRFNEWEKNRRDKMDDDQSLAAVFELFELIPEDARQREINVEGIIKMHKALACLK